MPLHHAVHIRYGPQMGQQGLAGTHRPGRMGPGVHSGPGARPQDPYYEQSGKRLALPRSPFLEPPETFPVLHSGEKRIAFLFIRLFDAVNQRGRGPGYRGGRGMQIQGGVGHPSSSGQQMNKRIRWFVALFDYNPKTMSPNPDACEDELSFSNGDTIKVLDRFSFLSFRFVSIVFTRQGFFFLDRCHEYSFRRCTARKTRTDSIGENVAADKDTFLAIWCKKSKTRINRDRVKVEGEADGEIYTPTCQ